MAADVSRMNPAMRESDTPSSQASACQKSRGCTVSSNIRPSDGGRRQPEGMEAARHHAARSPRDTCRERAYPYPGCSFVVRVSGPHTAGAAMDTAGQRVDAVGNAGF